MSKMFKCINSFGLVAVSVRLVLALPLGWVVPAKAAEEKQGRTVNTGHFGKLTSPGAISFTVATYGAVDAARWKNDQGEIDGIKVTSWWEDTRGSSPAHITIHRKFKRGE